MLIVACKSDLSKILEIIENTYNYNINHNRIMDVVSKRYHLAPNDISILELANDHKDVKRVLSLVDRSDLKLKGDGRGNITGLDFSFYDQKPFCEMLLDKERISGDDEKDIVSITFKLDRKWSGVVELPIKSPINIIPKILKFDNTDTFTFTFHSWVYGCYIFPAYHLKEFQPMNTKKFSVVA